jgi:hypothetical protein
MAERAIGAAALLRAARGDLRRHEKIRMPSERADLHHAAVDANAMKLSDPTTIDDPEPAPSPRRVSMGSSPDRWQAALRHCYALRAGLSLLKIGWANSGECRSLH